MHRSSVRPASHDDGEAIADVARRCGQPALGAAPDATYRAHLMENGQMWVAEDVCGTLGFAGTIRVGSALMLTDLFVRPDVQGRGVGRELLAEAWSPTGPKITFASLHPAALPLYSQYGLVARWPLLYLFGSLTGGPAEDVDTSLRLETVSAETAALAEASFTGVGRLGAYRYWADRTGGFAVLVRNRDEPVAAGAMLASQGRSEITHLRCDPQASPTDVLFTVLRWLRGSVRVCLPGPHPAVPLMLSSGFRVTDLDLHMATPGDALADVGAYSPAFG